MILALALCLGCAAAELPPAAAPVAAEPPSAATVLAEAALVFGRAEAGCAVDDATCCTAVAGRMREDRTRGDDAAADEEAERLALFCPAHRRGSFSPARRNPPEVSARVGLAYDVQIAPADRLVWVGAYFRKTRLDTVAVGPGTLEVELRIAAGDGRGEAFTLRRAVETVLEKGQLLWPTAVVRPTSGPERYSLELQSATPHGSLGSSLVAGSRAAPDNPDSPIQLRQPAAPFVPPAELAGTGAPVARVFVSLTPDGQIGKMVLNDLASPHPRQVAAALDWTRRLQYQPPQHRSLMVCNRDDRIFRFDQAAVPLSQPQCAVEQKPAPARSAR